MARRLAAGLLTSLVLAAAYLVAGKVAFTLAFVHTSIAPVWLPSGLAIAAVVRRGRWAVPGVWLGAFVFNALTPTPLWVTAAISVGNTLEATAAGWLLGRTGLRQQMDRARDVVVFAAGAALGCTAISATGGVFALWTAGLLPAAAIGPSWLLWWSGDAVGVLTLTPVLLSRWVPGWSRPRRAQVLETGALIACMAVVGWAGLGTRQVGPFVVFPVVAWAAMRYPSNGAHLVALSLSAVAVWATGHGHGPFLQPSLTGSLLLTQSFVAVVVVTGLLVSVLSVQREYANRQLRHALAEIAERNAELNRSNVELLQLDQLKDTFLATVSHELRTPLTSIRGYTEILIDGDAGPLTATAHRALVTIDENGQRLQNLIEDLLTITHVAQTTTTPRYHDVDLRALAVSACTRASPAGTVADVVLTIDAPPTVPAVLGDAEQLARVLDNLISNAIKFTLEPGTVTVRLRHDGHHVTMEIVDGGIGIPVEEQRQLFTRFFRSSLSQQHTIRGTGLGLAITKAIVDAHSGQIHVRSAPSTGTTITVTLPIAPAPLHGTDGPTRSDVPVATATSQ